MKKITAAILSFMLTAVLLVSAATALEHKGRVSDAYKSSVYYERLTAVELTGDQRRDIVNVSLSQVGYHEGDSRDDFGGGNLFGKNEYTEYNYYNGDIGGDYSYYWCASFVTFCARLAGISEDTIMNSVSCDRFVERFSSRNEYIDVNNNKKFKPQTADLIFFLEDDADREYASHIGIVLGTDEKYVYTVEGNTKRGVVNTRRYEFDDEDIVGYAVPNYSGAKNDYDFELTNKSWFIPGKYVVNTGNLNLRSGADTKYGVVAVVPRGTTLILTEAEGDWAKTYYSGVTGWISLVYMMPEDLGTVQLTYMTDPQVIETRYKYAAGGFTVSDIEPEKENFDFEGWSTTENGTVKYKAGDTVETTSDIKLYPIWRIKTVPTVIDVDETTPETEAGSEKVPESEPVSGHPEKQDARYDSVTLYGNIAAITVMAAIIATAIIMFIKSSEK